MKIYRSAFNMQRRQREEEICRILERGSAGMSQAAGSMSESLGKKKKKNKARNKFRESSSGGLGTADADGVEAAAAVREQAPAHKKKADVHKQKAPAAAGGLAPTGKEGGHQTVGGATVKQAVKQAGAGVSGVSKEGLVKIKIDYPHPHTWVFEQQPKRTAYGGIGFAKPSTWLPMPTDRNSVEYSDFIDKFEEVYNEHIEYGSTGKAFIKGFKREREANMLWRVKLREKIEEDGGGKKKKSKKGKEDKGRGNGVVEGGDGGEGGATSSRGDMMKERVKKRRAVAKAQQSRSMPKVQVDENLQTSAIEAYRRMKEAKKAPQNLDRVQPGPGRQSMAGVGGSPAPVGGWGLLASRR